MVMLVVHSLHQFPEGSYEHCKKCNNMQVTINTSCLYTEFFVILQSGNPKATRTCTHFALYFEIFTCALRNHQSKVGMSLYTRDCKKITVSSADGVSDLMEARDFLLLRLENALLTFFLTPLWQGHSNMFMTHGHMNIREKGLGEEPL